MFSAFSRPVICCVLCSQGASMSSVSCSHSVLCPVFSARSVPCSQPFLSRVLSLSCPVFSARPLFRVPCPQDVSLFVPVYQHRKDPSAVFSATAEDAGFRVLSCHAPNSSYVFENANYLKSEKYLYWRNRFRFECNRKNVHSN